MSRDVTSWSPALVLVTKEKVLKELRDQRHFKLPVIFSTFWDNKEGDRGTSYHSGVNENID